jgi:DNA polymerase III alpha subunit
MGVSVGPGRRLGSGGVLFENYRIRPIDVQTAERFLNPDRVSLPDIDIDFDDSTK